MMKNKQWDTSKLREFIDKLRRGIKFDSVNVFVSEHSPGRFAEEENLKVVIAEGNISQYLLSMKVFWGRPPYYRPWVELFSIKKQLNLGALGSFFGSTLEKDLITELANDLPQGSSLFVEYVNDTLTTKEIVAGVPSPFTRLGYLMLCSGLTWFKDWYYSEGLREGNIKLQGEKALTEKDLTRQMMEITRIAHSIIERDPNNEIWNIAKRRASEWLAGI